MDRVKTHTACRDMAGDDYCRCQEIMSAPNKKKTSKFLPAPLQDSTGRAESDGRRAAAGSGRRPTLLLLLAVYQPSSSEAEQGLITQHVQTHTRFHC